jgi:MFS superfamily sulfate permease-like transporter
MKVVVVVVVVMAGLVTVAVVATVVIAVTVAVAVIAAHRYDPQRLFFINTSKPQHITRNRFQIKATSLQFSYVQTTKRNITFWHKDNPT